MALRQQLRAQIAAARLASGHDPAVGVGPLVAAAARIGVDRAAAHLSACDQRRQRRPGFGRSSLAPLGRIDPRDPHPPAGVLDIGAAQRVAIDGEGGQAEEDQQPAYSRPNCAFWISFPSWNIAFAFAPKPPSPSHWNIWVRVPAISFSLISCPAPPMIASTSAWLIPVLI